MTARLELNFPRWQIQASGFCDELFSIEFTLVMQNKKASFEIIANNRRIETQFGKISTRLKPTRTVD